MKTLRIIASTVFSVAMLVAPVSTVYAGFFPADRPTYTCVTPDNCPGADHVTFNSFTNNPVVGDERAFLAGSLNAAPVQDRIKVKDGDTIVVRAYVHNNADATKMGGEANTVAKNVNIKILVPTASQTDTNLVGFISASNASPASINDTMSLFGDSAFTLEYVKGSAQFTRKADGVHQITSTLNDSIVTSAGAPLGDMNGCFAYSGYVTLQVKVHMPETEKPKTPVFSCDAFDVTMGDNRTVTVNKFNFTAANGATFNNAVVTWGDSSSNTYTNVLGQKHTYAKDGTYTISAVAHFTVNGKDVTASGNCAKTVTFNTPGVPPTLPNTGAGQVIGLFGAVAVASAFAHRLFVSRRQTR